MINLTLDQLTIRRGSKEICQQLSMTMQPGQCWGLIGRNGQGKTTFLHTLCGLLKAISGRVLLDNVDLHTLSRRHIAERMGLLLQPQRFLFPTSVLDAIHSATYAINRKTSPALHATIMQTLQLESLAAKGVLELSGGEQQRVALARLLHQDPDILLLDEPTSFLDPLFQHKVLGYLQKQCRTANRLVMFSCHDINLVARYCDHLILLLPSGEVRHGALETILTADNLAAMSGCHWQEINEQIWCSYEAAI